jgi:hypothetical protein
MNGANMLIPRISRRIQEKKWRESYPYKTEQAVAEIKANTMTYRAAPDYFGVTVGAIQSRLRGAITRQLNGQNRRILGPASEKALKEYMLSGECKGLTLSKLKGKAQMLVYHEGKDHVLGHNWIGRFLKRHCLVQKGGRKRRTNKKASALISHRTHKTFSNVSKDVVGDRAGVIKVLTPLLSARYSSSR